MHFPEEFYNEIFHKNAQPQPQEGAIVKPAKPAKKVEEPEVKVPEAEPEQEEEVAEPEEEADDPE